MRPAYKRLLKAVLVLLPFFGIIIYACKKDDAPATGLQQTDTTVALVRADTLENGLALPAGAYLSYSPDHPHTVHVFLPGPYRYIGLTNENATVESKGIDITCLCSKGSGCNPWFNSYGMGCMSFGGCSVCTQIVTANGALKVLSPNAYLPGGVVVDLSLGIRFITSKAEMQATPPIVDAMAADSTISTALGNFLAPYQQHYLSQVRMNDTARVLPPGYRMMPVSVYGHSLLVPVEESITPACAVTDIHPVKAATEEGEAESSIGSGYSCSCGSGTGCTYHYRWFPIVGMTAYCASGVCISCTLHVPDSQ
ncbi:hypothetical protein [Dinghuibacter silviterrae]|uniref:Lipoprotein n=1 Tax=Dinghuibacter silviterrae TaxID=1539049 RepID=A0A4R8DHU6_9BACT|nr:hypothetical protein [Dinghuibacter silviterrae]TDW97115.1 hypothetical protein EDB95_4956 [Dinghuibacter silviterrae]